MKIIYSKQQLISLSEALSNPIRLEVISSLFVKSQYVSELAREVGISRPLLYLHLQKLEEANLVESSMEISETGKALKYYALNSFRFELNERLIHELISLEKNKNKQE